MILIGDVHGNFDRYLKIVSKYKETIQLGDFGLGFGGNPPTDLTPYGEHYFIRGNHDSPKECKEHQHYLGDYGIYNGIYFLSGAYSIDYAYRQKYKMKYGKDVWWEDEELQPEVFNNVIDLYSKYKPNIVISHDGPFDATQFIRGGNGETKLDYYNKTNRELLPALFRIHKPELWVFAHYHTSFRWKIEKTLFICLNELETLKI